MTPPPRPKRRRNETRELVMPIMAALNAMPGVRVWRPHVLAGAARDVAGAGLAVGSSDLVGIAQCHYYNPTRPVGRFLSMEVKWPGKKPSDDQTEWMRIIRNLGGFACVVHSISEAHLAIERCWEGKPS